LIHLKDIDVLKGLITHPAHPILIQVLGWLNSRYPDQITITCAYESRRDAALTGKVSLHSTIPFRAIDIRSSCFNNPEEVEERINQYWVYDPDEREKKVALYHDVGRGLHIHVQVTDRTKRL
jgi:hypothetical protein